MERNVSTLLAQIARIADSKDHQLLSYLLRMAALEAAKNVADLPAFQLPLEKMANAADQIIGMWDWDVGNNRNYLDRRAAEYFNTDPDLASQGLPNEVYGEAIHPEDIGGNIEALNSAIKNGGVYMNEFRVIQNDRIRWVHCRGLVTLDKSNRPSGFPGVIVDITHERLDGISPTLVP